MAKILKFGTISENEKGIILDGFDIDFENYSGIPFNGNKQIKLLLDCIIERLKKECSEIEC